MKISIIIPVYWGLCRSKSSGFAGTHRAYIGNGGTMEERQECRFGSPERPPGGQRADPFRQSVLLAGKEDRAAPDAQGRF